MKKILFTLGCFTIFFQLAFTRDFYLGVVAGGFGTTMARGGDYNKFLREGPSQSRGLDGESTGGGDGELPYSGFVGFPYSMNLSPAVDIVGQVNYLNNHIGLELGIGFSMLSVAFRLNESDYESAPSRRDTEIDMEYNRIDKFTLTRISLPAILKLQTNLNSFIHVYAGGGGRVHFNLGRKFEYYEVGMSAMQGAAIIRDKYSSEFAAIDVDATVVTGIDLVAGKAHYVGLRASYNFNLLGSFMLDHERQNIFIDGVGFSVSYKYKISGRAENRVYTFRR